VQGGAARDAMIELIYRGICGRHHVVYLQTEKRTHRATSHHKDNDHSGETKILQPTFFPLCVLVAMALGCTNVSPPSMAKLCCGPLEI